MLIPSHSDPDRFADASLSRRVNANSQQGERIPACAAKLIKKGEC